MNKNLNPELLKEAVKPLLENKIALSDQRMLLHEMFVTCVCNAPDDEIDNFTANRLSNFYLSLIQTLENLEKYNLS